MFDSVNKTVSGIRKQMTALEKNRLKDNFDKMPKDIMYLTKSEIDLKRNLVNMIEEVENFLVM